MNADKRQGQLRRDALERVEILPVEPGDAGRISVLAREIWERHYPGIISAAQIEYMLAQRYEPRLIRAELQRDDLWWDKLLAAGRLAGFASYFLSGQPGEMKLDKLYVHQDHQRRGYGGLLISHVSRQSRARGCSRLVLAVNRSNTNAIAAYRKHGFEVREAAVKDIGGGFVMDDYIMVREIRNVSESG
ncbi:MAG: GNAT family N-acetyltransferase [Betaproteobacteria bacterium]|nr:GNAT family N-acetyltransferase [Betaproteobacteria bacterium]